MSNTKTIAALAAQELGDIPAQLLLARTDRELELCIDDWKRMRRRHLMFSINANGRLVPRAMALKWAKAIYVDRRLMEHAKTHDMSRAVAEFLSLTGAGA